MTKNKLNEILKRLKYYLLKGKIFCQVEHILQPMMVINFFLVLSSILCSLILETNKKVINWLSFIISPKRFKPFDINRVSTITDLANSRISLKFNKSVLVQIFFII